MAKTPKLTIERGTTYTRSGTVKIDGVAVSLVGATVRFTVKTANYDSDTTDTSAVIKKNITNGTVLGAYSILITPTDTATLEPGQYYFDTKVDMASNGVTVYQIDEGIINLSGNATNRLS